jgi:hypothetical protein
MPVLSPGRHRNPRKGACFMEFASYLAGEKWSDRPACTHPALAEAARSVNDHIGDEVRQQMLPLVPEVIGLSGRLPLVDLWIARECALAALPIVSESRQRVVALGLLRCESVIAAAEGRPSRDLSPRTRAALDDVPLAHVWATAFCQEGLAGERTLRGISAAAIIDYAVLGISEAAVEDPDAVLLKLLQDLIAQCKEWFGVPSPEPTTRPPTDPERHHAPPPTSRHTSA